MHYAFATGVGTPRTFFAQVTGTQTNTALDGTGTMALLVTGKAGTGTKITSIRYQATAATTAQNWLRFFVSYDAGTTKRFLTEISIAASGTISLTVRPISGIDTSAVVPLELFGDQQQLYVCQEKADTINVFANAGGAVAVGGDY